MYLDIAARFNFDLASVPVVGDSLRDLGAAVAVGATPYLVLTGKGGRTLDEGGLPAGTRIFPDLASVVAELTADK